MNRFIAIASFAVFVAGCADSPAAPTLARPTGPSFDAGDPPPPPITGEGFAEFDASRSDAGGFSFAGTVSDIGDFPPGPCRASRGFGINYSYFINKNNTNAVLHIDPDDASHHVTLHQTAKKLDGSGQIVGPDFVFKISDVVAGGIIGPEERLPGAVFVSLRGTLTLADGTSCQADAQLGVFLRGE
jgi:hypothetical protein